MSLISLFRKRPTLGTARNLAPAAWRAVGFVGMLVLAAAGMKFGAAADALALDDGGVRIERGLALDDDGTPDDGPAVSADGLQTLPVSPYSPLPIAAAIRGPVPDLFLVPYGNGPPSAV